jgi:hypothetical protein
MMLIHMRRSSAFFQGRDHREGEAIRAMADICMKLREAALGKKESKPLVLCLVSRETLTGRKDCAILKHARACDAVVDVRDFDLSDTMNYVQHLFTGPSVLSSDSPAAMSAPLSPGLPPFFYCPSSCSSDADSSFSEPLAGSQSRTLEQSSVKIIAEYVYEMTGGNSLGVEVMLQALDSQKVIHAREDGTIALAESYMDGRWLRKMLTLPKELVGMAFGTFERLDARAQMILKAASTLQHVFEREELEGAVSDLPEEERRMLIDKLVEPTAKVLTVVSKEPPKFRFYSGLLRHAASTLVLHSQRNEVKRKTYTHLVRKSQLMSTTEGELSRQRAFALTRLAETHKEATQDFSEEDSDEDSEISSVVCSADGCSRIFSNDDSVKDS